MHTIALGIHGINTHWLGALGNDWIETPTFDLFATQATIFQHCYTPRPTLTGFHELVQAALGQPNRQPVIYVPDLRSSIPRLAVDHQVAVNNIGPGDSPAAALRRAIKEAIALLPNDRPGTLLIETDRLLPPWELEYSTYIEYVEKLGEFIETSTEPPGELPEPTDHPPEGPVAFASQGAWAALTASFAAAVSAFDSERKRLFDFLSIKKLFDTARVVVFSGVGQPLGEHGYIGQRPHRLYDESYHLPVLIKHPQSSSPGRRHLKLCSLEQVINEIVAPGPTIDFAPSTERIVACTVPGSLPVTLRTPEYALLRYERLLADLPPQIVEELYEKPDDYWEVNDLAPRSPDLVDELRLLIQAGDSA